MVITTKNSLIRIAFFKNLQFLTFLKEFGRDVTNLSLQLFDKQFLE